MALKTLALLCLVVCSCFGQAVRFDPLPATTTNPQAAINGQLPQILALPFATINLCNYPANGLPCTNYATGYTDATGVTACTIGLPVVAANGSTCSAMADAQGNFGFWVAPGNYSYSISLNGVDYGPYAFTAGGGGTNTFPPVNVKNAPYGAIGNGIHDDAPNIQAAINANAGVIIIPAGTYKACSTLTLRSGVYLVAQDATLVACSASQTQASLSYGIATMAHAGISGLTFSGNGLNSILGLSCTFCQDFRLQNNTFIGENPFTFDRGGQSVYIDFNLNKGDLVAHGAGTATIWSSLDTDYIFGVEMTGYTVHNTGNGLTGNGMYIRRAVSLNVSHVQINDARTGGTQINVVFENDCQGDRLTDSIFGAGTAAVVVQQGSGVAVAPSFLTLSNIDSDQQTTAGFLIFQGNYLNITGGKVTSSGAANSASGVLVQNGSFIQLTGMQFNGFTTGAGINLVTANEVAIADDLFQNDSVGIGFMSTTAKSDAHGNIFNSDVTTPIAGSPTAHGNWIHDNLGTISPGNLAPAFPVTATPYTYDSAYTVRYSITGGTVSAVAVNGISNGTASTGILQPGDTITITYTGSPAWTWSPLH